MKKSFFSRIFQGSLRLKVYSIFMTARQMSPQEVHTFPAGRQVEWGSWGAGGQRASG